MFNKTTYDKIFNASLKKLGNAEKITRAVLMDLSRSILEAFHSTEDVSYLNRLIDVLTPVNKRTAVLYFKEFSGFFYSEKEGKFEKKNKKEYAEKAEKAARFLDDPLNNIWSWSERHLEMEAKPFDISKITSYMTSALKKAHAEGISDADVLRAVFQAGMSADALTVIMGELANQGHQEEALM